MLECFLVMNKPFLWSLCFVFASPFLYAQGHRPVLLKPFVTEASSSMEFHTAADGKGGLYLFWTHPLEGDTCALLAQHADAEGHSLWDLPGITLVPAVPNPKAWDAFADGQGGFIVVAEQNGHVQAERFNADHQPQWPVQDDLVSSSPHPQAWPVGISDGLGGAYVIWLQKDYPDRWVLMRQHLNALGAALWGPLGGRVSLRPSDQRRARVVPDGQGGFIVGWADFRENASQLQAQRISPLGDLLWGDQGVVITAPADNNGDRSLIESVGDGAAVAAWPGSSAGVNHLWLQYIDPTGNLKWGSDGQGVSNGSWDMWNPAIVGDGDRGCWVGWEDYRSHSNWQIFIQHFHADGQPVWPNTEIPVTSIHSGQGHLALANDGEKGLVMAWVDNRSGAPALYAQRINAQGQWVWDPRGIRLADSLVNPSTPVIVMLATGQAVVIWVDHTDKDLSNLYTSFAPTAIQ